MSKFFTRVYREIWDDPKFTSMTINGQHVFLYLLSCPVGSQFGIFRAGIGSLVDHYKNESKVFRKGFDECLGQGLAEHSQEDMILYLPRYIERNPPNNPNVVKAWGRQWQQLPDCFLKSKSHAEIQQQIGALGKAFAEAFAKSFPKPSGRLCESIPESPSEYIVQSSEFSVQSSEPPNPPVGVDIEFEKFWKAYPKKTGKIKARKAFDKAKKNTTLSAMLDAIEKQRGSDKWTKDAGQYIPNPATWLNEGRWDDEIEVPLQRRSNLQKMEVLDWMQK